MTVPGQSDSVYRQRPYVLYGGQPSPLKASIKVLSLSLDCVAISRIMQSTRGFATRIKSGITMSHESSRAACLFICLLVCCAQALQVRAAVPAPPPQQAQQIPEKPKDPLGRDTPRGTVLGFVQAAQGKNYDKAMEYLQFSEARKKTEGQSLVDELKLALDTSFSGALNKISDAEEGSMDPELPLDREHAGVFLAGHDEIPLILARVRSKREAGQYWLISSETLARIPEINDGLKVQHIERYVPEAFIRWKLFGMAAWQWISLVLMVPAAVLASWLVVRSLQLTRRLWMLARRRIFTPGPLQGLIGPLVMILAVVVHAFVCKLVGMPLLERTYYRRTAMSVLVIGFTWLLWLIIGQVASHVRERAMSSHRVMAGFTALVAGVLKTVLIFAAAAALLTGLGVKMTTTLAGVGIGGIAISLAAQKTLENLIAGLSILGDKVICVGDTCRFGNQVGVVENIGCRSTRIRSLQGTVLSVPNRTVAEANVENLSRRQKDLFNVTIDLRLDTTREQMCQILEETRRMLDAHPKIEEGSESIRFSGVGDHSFGVEIFANTLTTNSSEFSAVREDLWFRILAILDAAGAALAGGEGRGLSSWNVVQVNKTADSHVGGPPFSSSEAAGGGRATKAS